jgi:hypothetical protein
VLCETLAVAWPPVGPVRAYLTSDATVTGTLVGSAPMHAEACLFGPPQALSWPIYASRRLTEILSTPASR